jgi:hypothetical protein
MLREAGRRFFAAAQNDGKGRLIMAKRGRLRSTSHAQAGERHMRDATGGGGGLDLIVLLQTL